MTGPILTKLFSYEKSSNFFAGTTPALFHNVIPRPALKRVGTHPVKIVLKTKPGGFLRLVYDDRKFV
jgi:hypothetical protein